MYEKTIAVDHRIYGVNLPGSQTKIIDLLSSADKEDYTSFLENFVSSNVGECPRKYNRIVVDGYIVCPSSVMLVSTTLGGAEEPVPAGIQFTSPVAFWLDKTFVRGSGSAYVRIFFS